MTSSHHSILKRYSKNSINASQETQSVRTCAGLQLLDGTSLHGNSQDRFDIKGLRLCSGRSSHVSLRHGTPGQHRDIRRLCLKIDILLSHGRSLIVASPALPCIQNGLIRLMLFPGVICPESMTLFVYHAHCVFAVCSAIYSSLMTISQDISASQGKSV